MIYSGTTVFATSKGGFALAWEPSPSAVAKSPFATVNLPLENEASPLACVLKPEEKL